MTCRPAIGGDVSTVGMIAPAPLFNVEIFLVGKVVLGKPNML